MCAKYILDSVLYWVQEYHIDGFRFDLMGLLDTALMNRIREELDARYGVGEKLIYGEPWRAADTAARPGTVLCTKDNLKKLNINIGAFSDDIRDAVKGSVMDINAVGFVNGVGIDAEVLRRCVAGWAGENGPNQAPSQTLTYLSCHDDWTLWDKLVYTMDPKRNFTGSAPGVLRANRLAAAINFCCQGRPFFLAGEEFARSKGGIKNSYCSSADVNRLDWQRAWDNQKLVDYYRGLIALRMRLPGLRDKSAAAGGRILWAENAARDCAVVCLDNRGADTEWAQLLMIFSCGEEPQQVKLPAGKWQILVDGDSSFRWQSEEAAEGFCTVKPLSALILGKL